MAFRDRKEEERKKAAAERKEQQAWRDRIADYIERGVCIHCEQPVKEGQSVYSITGAHWDCHERENARTKADIERYERNRRG